jgi:hypothetical protein
MKKILLAKLVLFCLVAVSTGAWSQGWAGLGISPNDGASNGTVKAVAVWNGNVYIAGAFTTVGGSVSASNIAKWDGTTSAWSALGSGITGTSAEVKALCVYNNVLYAAGHFTTAGGVTASNIAKWDGSTWSALGATQGTGNDVYALIVFNNLLYAGGSFLTAGGVSAHYVASWNGSAWSGSGTGTSAPVYCFTIHGSFPVLYTGENGGLTLECLVGVSWNQVIAGFGGAGQNVQSLASFGTYIYLSGNFTFGPDKDLMRWDPQSSSVANVGNSTPLLINPGSTVTYANTMKVFNNALWVGGNFTDAGAVANTSHLAKWNGTSWSSAYVSPSALDNNVYAIDTGITGSVPYIFVGGLFTAPFHRVMKGVTTVGVTEIAVLEGMVSVYPNPSHGTIIIFVNREIKDPVVEIYMIEGRKVYTEAIKSDFESAISKELAPGIYFVKVSSGTDVNNRFKVFTQKIVID